MAVIFGTIAIALAILFGFCQRRFRAWPLLIASACWGLAAIYEWWFTTFYDPRGQFDIRVDLLLAAGLASVVTLLCAAWSFRPKRDALR